MVRGEERKGHHVRMHQMLPGKLTAALIAAALGVTLAAIGLFAAGSTSFPPDGLRSDVNRVDRVLREEASQPKPAARGRAHADQQTDDPTLVVPRLTPKAPPESFEHTLLQQIDTADPLHAVYDIRDWMYARRDVEFSGSPESISEQRYLRDIESINIIEDQYCESPHGDESTCTMLRTLRADLRAEMATWE